MKKFIPLFALLLVACGADSSETPIPVMDGKFIGNMDFPRNDSGRLVVGGTLYVFQHNVSGNCYAYHSYGSSSGFSMVACEDFIVKQESEEEMYNRLKEKYEK